MVNFYQKSKEEVLEILKTKETGLNQKEAILRLRIYNLNKLKEKNPLSKISIFFSQFKSFIIYILIVAVVISLFTKDYPEAILIAIILFINAILGFVQEYRAEKSIRALKRLSTPKSIVLRDKKETIINSTEIVPGDVLILEAGSKVPADCYILKSFNLTLNESLLTGESTPVYKKECMIKGEVQVSDRSNMIFSGTTIVDGRAKAVVTTTGMNTEIGKIAEEIREIKPEPTPLQNKLSHLGKFLGYVVLIITVIVFLVGTLRGIETLEMLKSSIALAIAAIPEGLPAIATICLAIGITRMAKQNALIRKLSSVETLGSTTVICADKTGTLTKNEMAVTKIFSNNIFIDITEGKFLHDEKKVQTQSIKKLLETAFLCNNSKIIDNNPIGDPTEIALLITAEKANIKPNYERLDEIPFTSEKKYMVTINKIKEKEIAHIKGATEVILEKSRFILINNKIQLLTKDYKEKIIQANKEMADSALRVIALAYSKDNKTQNLIFLGLMGMIDPPRKDAIEAIKLCKKAGIRVIMITGDHVDTAKAIAKQLNIGTEAITGEEIDKLKSLDSVINKISIYARVSPEHKVNILNALKKQDHIIAMTGDGANDAPALNKADIGIAVGSGTDVAKESSDMILTNNNFSSIVSAIKEGRHVFSNIKKFIHYLITSNFGEILTIFLALLIGFPLPIIALQLLWINIISDGLPALSLGLEKPEKGIMSNPPRPPKEGIISKKILYKMLTHGSIMAIGTLVLFKVYLFKSLMYAQTMAFTSLVMFQMFNVINFRSEKSLSKIGFFSNKKLLYAIIASIALQILILYTPLSISFKTVPLKLYDWIWVIIISSTILFYAEIKKRIKNFN